jgi:predicted nucleic acid-binding protein
MRLVLTIGVVICSWLMGCTEPETTTKHSSSTPADFPMDEAVSIATELTALSSEIASERELEFLYRHAVTILSQVRQVQITTSEHFELCTDENKILNSTIKQLAVTTELRLDLEGLFTQLKDKNSLPLCWYGNATAWHLVNTVLLLKQSDVLNSVSHLKLAELHFEQYLRSLKLLSTKRQEAHKSQG